MCTIYLMRHGSTPMDVLKRSDGWLDLPLSDKGRMGLVPGQQYLKLEPLKTIYAAPLRRTCETAQIIESGVMTRPDVVTSEKAMTWNLGVLAGLRKEEAKPKVKRLLETPNEAPMGGESYNAFKRRYMGWFKTRTEQAKKSNKPILIIASGSNLRLLGKVLFGDPKVMNLDEGGLVKLTELRGKWHHEAVFGDPADEDEIS